MHPLHDALPGPYVPVRVTLGALVAHRYTYALPRSRTFQYHWTFIALSVSLLLTPYSMVWHWQISRAGPMLSYWPKLLYPYYRSASERLRILRKSWRVFHDKLLIERCFWGFVLPVLEYCSAVRCSAANTHLKLLDRVVSGACFLAGGVLNCNLSHRRSVAVLCMLYKIRCNPKHPLCGALPVTHVPVRVTRGAWIAHRYTYAPPHCRTSQYRMTFIPLSVSLWNDLVEPVFDDVGLSDFKSRSNAFLSA